MGKAKMPVDQSGLTSPLFTSPRMWSGPGEEGQTLLPSSKQVPSKPIIVRRPSPARLYARLYAPLPRADTAESRRGGWPRTSSATGSSSS